jgi:alpha-1,2-mannosyltransferase
MTKPGQIVQVSGLRAARNSVDDWLLIGGLVALGVALLWYAHLVTHRPGGILEFPVDLNVYRDAGLIVRHVRPFYRPRRPSPLYDWPGFAGLKFDYPPFAALPFALLSFLSLHALGHLFAVADLAAVPAAIWITFGALGYPRGRRRAGLTLLATAVALMAEPVLRTITLGQIEIFLMVLVIWDLCQPDRRWWKGAGVGLAAGIKLVPLIFIPYLLLTRRFRQAAIAAGTFAATVLIGFIALPRDSSRWWLQGLFLHGTEYSTIGYAGNQSLLAIFARADSPSWHSQWLSAAVATAVLGLAAAALLDRAGERVLGLLTCALTGLLVSPISWDHHWVWIVLATPLLAHYALKARGVARCLWLGLAGLIAGLFGAWPTWLWGEIRDPHGWRWGLIWSPPNHGGEEHHWHGFQLIVGNTYVLTGLALFVLVVVLAVVAGVTGYRSRARAAPASSPGGPVERPPDPSPAGGSIPSPQQAGPGS